MIGRLLRRARFNTTPAGRAVLFLIIVSGYATLISPFVPLHHFASALFSIYLVGALAQRVGRRRVAVELVLPESARAGHPAELRIEARNEGAHPLVEVGAAFFGLPEAVEPVGPPPHRARLEAGEKAVFVSTLLPHRRGLHKLPPAAVYSLFPFGLSRRALGESAERTLKVDPAWTPLAELELPLGRLHQPGGIALTSHQGESPEYIGSREFRPGDPVKRLDHRTWARLGKPAVREYQEEYYARVALVLDTHVPPGRKRPKTGFPELEAGVSLAAAVAEKLARDEYVIDLFAAGPDLYVFQAGRNLAHLRQVLDVLACVEESRENPFETIAPAIAGELSRLTAIVCVFLAWDEPRRRFVRECAESGAAPRVILVGDGAYPAEADDATPLHPVEASAVLAGKVDRL